MGVLSDVVFTCVLARLCYYQSNMAIFPARTFTKLLTVTLICLAPWLVRAYLGKNSMFLIPAAQFLSIMTIRCTQLLSCKCQLRKRIFSDPIVCYNILATTGIDDSRRLARDNLGDTPGHNIMPGLESRSKPNRRLRETFGIENSFTTTDDSYCQKFRNAVEHKLNLSIKEWKEIAVMAQWPIRAQVSGRKRIGLVKLVQILSLRIILRILFGLDPMDADDKDIEMIAEEINRLWLESKGERDVKDSFFMDEGKLSRALSTIIPNSSWDSWITYIVPTYRTFNRSMNRLLPQRLQGVLPNVEATSCANPLNLILPAYETLWRVVLRCFVEVVFRNEAHENESRAAFQAFLAAPNMKVFREASLTQSGVSVEFIVNEALRLYPPTRRIYREFLFPDKEKPEIVAADLETCQRKQSIWGPDSLQFNPSRWKSIKRDTTEDKESYPYAAFMPFGVKRFLCPANADFGPRMIAVLTGVLAAKFSSDEWRLVSADERDERMDSDRPLASNRSAFWSYELVRIARLEGEVNKVMAPSEEHTLTTK